MGEQERTYRVFIDAATGLYDRRTMWSRLAEEVSRARRYRYPLSLMLVAFDPQAGQNTLENVRYLAEILKQYTRTSDFLARYNEDTLALLLPCTNERGALLLAERISQLAAVVAPGRGRPALQVRIGLTSAPAEYEGDKVALVEQVEWALRQARAQGSRYDTVVVPVPRASSGRQGDSP